MANPTLGDIKQFVATQMGNSNGAESVSKRDMLINRARAEYYQARKWNWALKTVDITMTDSQGDLPADYSTKFGANTVYSYSGGVEYSYELVPLDQISSLSTNNYGYAIDVENRKLVINQATTPITLSYWAVPADAPIDTTQDATSELAPDITAIGYLSISFFWLSAERSIAKYQMFHDLYETKVKEDKLFDSRQTPARRVNQLTADLGYNNVNNGRTHIGYISKR